MNRGNPNRTAQKFTRKKTKPTPKQRKKKAWNSPGKRRKIQTSMYPVEVEVSLLLPFFLPSKFQAGPREGCGGWPHLVGKVPPAQAPSLPRAACFSRRRRVTHSPLPPSLSLSPWRRLSYLMLVVPTSGLPSLLPLGGVDIITSAHLPPCHHPRPRLRRRLRQRVRQKNLSHTCSPQHPQQAAESPLSCAYSGRRALQKKPWRGSRKERKRKFAKMSSTSRAKNASTFSPRKAWTQQTQRNSRGFSARRTNLTYSRPRPRGTTMTSTSSSKWDRETRSPPLSRPTPCPSARRAEWTP